MPGPYPAGGTAWPGAGHYSIPGRGPGRLAVTRAAQFLPSGPNFGSSESIFVDQANLTAEIVGNALHLKGCLMVYTTPKVVYTTLGIYHGIYKIGR
jgi:hypothetical protein